MNIKEIQLRELILLAEHINRADDLDIHVHSMVDQSGTPLYSLQQPKCVESDPEDFDNYDFDTLLGWCSYENCMLCLEAFRISRNLPEPTTLSC